MAWSQTTGTASSENNKKKSSTNEIERLNECTKQIGALTHLARKKKDKYKIIDIPINVAGEHLRKEKWFTFH